MIIRERGKMISKCLNPFVDEDLKQFLDILVEFGFQFRHVRKNKTIKIKGKVIKAGCNINKNFYISVKQANREFIVLESDHYYNIILRTPDNVKELAFPKDTIIEFRDSNLVIEY